MHVLSLKSNIPWFPQWHACRHTLQIKIRSYQEHIVSQKNSIYRTQLRDRLKIFISNERTKDQMDSIYSIKILFIRNQATEDHGTIQGLCYAITMFDTMRYCHPQSASPHLPTFPKKIINFAFAYTTL